MGGNKGQWPKGTSGNPKGRPPKSKPEPKSIVESLGEALAEEVTATGANGKPVTLPMQVFLAKKLVQTAAKLPAKELMAVLEKLEKLGVGPFVIAALEAKNEPPYEPILSEEARKLLAITKKALEDAGEDEFIEGQLGSGDGEPDVDGEEAA